MVGICQESFALRRADEQGGGSPPLVTDPAAFAGHVRSLGGGGLQTPLKPGDFAAARALRRVTEAHGMYFIGQLTLPADDGDLDRFRIAVQTHKEAGAVALRTFLLPGRRYERFASPEQFDETYRRQVRLLEEAEKVVRRYGLRLGLENHKDLRIDERLSLLERLSSEWIGVVVDLGNDIALLEEPLAPARAYAPWAVAVHLKDVAVEPCAEGFFVGDVPLGQGMIDLDAAVGALCAANPALPFLIEMHTRDPLLVPCLTDGYWATLAAVSGRELARTLRLVREQGVAEPLPRVSGLSREARLAREEENVKACLAYAREHLDLAFGQEDERWPAEC